MCLLLPQTNSPTLLLHLCSLGHELLVHPAEVLYCWQSFACFASPECSGFFFFSFLLFLAVDWTPPPPGAFQPSCFRSWSRSLLTSSRILASSVIFLRPAYGSTPGVTNSC